VNVGTMPEKEEQESRIALWTAGHPHDENFVVANRDRQTSQPVPAGAAKKAPPVSLLTVGIPVQFQIHDLAQWAYNHEDSATLLQQLATREVIRYLVSVDLNEIMSHGREESAVALRERIQAAADANHLGANVLFVGLQDLHPPVKVAPAYEKVVSAIHLKQSKILASQAYAIGTNIMAGAQAFTLTNNAEAARLDLELTASARAAAFTNQLPAYNAAPSVYLQRAYLKTFAAAAANTTKYLLLTTNTTDVLQFDLQRRLEDDIFNQVAGKIAAPKK